MNYPTCRWPECDRPGKIRGLCPRDYKRAKSVGDFDAPWEVWNKTPRGTYSELTECRWPGCDGEPKQQGLCWRDLDRARAVGNFRNPWELWNARPGRPETYARTGRSETCEWPGCDLPSRSRALCNTHYGRADRMGNLDRPWLTWQQYPNCQWCGEGFQASRSTQKFCSLGCAHSEWKDRNAARYAELALMAGHRRRARLNHSPSEKFTLAQVREQSGPDCYICGRFIDYSLKRPNMMCASIDHIIPIARGGGHTLSNAAMAHLVCNIRKGAKLPSEMGVEIRRVT